MAPRSSDIRRFKFKRYQVRVKSTTWYLFKLVCQYRCWIFDLYLASPIFLYFQLLRDQKIRKHERTIKELQATVNEQAVRLSNHEAIVNDLKRRYDELKSCISQQYPPVEKTVDGTRFLLSYYIKLNQNLFIL